MERPCCPGRGDGGESRHLHVVVGTNDSGLDAVYNYTLTVVRMPASFTVPANDEGGTLTNGGNHTGRMALGDLDPWTITTTAPNERLIFAIGELGTSPDPSAYPWIRVYGPTGALLDHSWNVLAAQVEVTAVSPGTYTVVVGTNDSGLDAIYDYTLTPLRIPSGYFQSPGDQGGALVENVDSFGAIALGDLDPWTFSACTGGTVSLTAATLPSTTDPSFLPWIRIYGPGRPARYPHRNAPSVTTTFTAPASGAYTVVVGTADSGLDAIGDYRVRVTGSCAPVLPPTSVDDVYTTRARRH